MKCFLATDDEFFWIYILAEDRNKARRVARGWEDELTGGSKSNNRIRVLRRPALDGDVLRESDVFQDGHMWVECYGCGTTMTTKGYRSEQYEEREFAPVIGPNHLVYCSEQCRDKHMAERPNASGIYEDGVVPLCSEG